MRFLQCGLKKTQRREDLALKDGSTFLQLMTDMLDSVTQHFVGAA